MFLNESIKNGPITMNRKLDDGTKRNLYSMLKSEDDSFYYKYNEFNNLNETIQMNPEFICENINKLRPEAQKGYDISCPKYYTIKIDKAFYGRLANDNEHCINSQSNHKTISKINKDCGRNVINLIKEKCEGNAYCTLLITKHFFKDTCKNVSKYLYIEYHCVKNLVNNFIIIN